MGYKETAKDSAVLRGDNSIDYPARVLLSFQIILLCWAVLCIVEHLAASLPFTH